MDPKSHQDVLIDLTQVPNGAREPIQFGYRDRINPPSLMRCTILLKDGRSVSFALNPPSTKVSTISQPRSPQYLSSSAFWASSDIPNSACLSVETRTYSATLTRHIAATVPRSEVWELVGAVWEG